MNKYFVLAAILAAQISPITCMQTPEDSIDLNSPFISTPLGAKSRIEIRSPLRFEDVPGARRGRLFVDEASMSPSTAPSVVALFSSLAPLSLPKEQVSPPAVSSPTSFDLSGLSLLSPEDYDNNDLETARIYSPVIPESLKNDCMINANEWALLHLAPDNVRLYETIILSLIAGKIAVELKDTEEFALLVEFVPPKEYRDTYSGALNLFLHACLEHLPAMKNFAKALPFHDSPRTKRQKTVKIWEVSAAKNPENLEVIKKLR